MNVDVRRCLVAITFLIQFFIASSSKSFSQAASAPAVRDASAIAIVNQALAAMGGANAWELLTSSQVTGECIAAPTQGGAAANFRWTTQGPEFRYETDTDNGGPVFLSGHGQPKLASSSGGVTLRPDYRDRKLPFHLPGVTFLTALSNSSIGLKSLGQEQLNGTRANHIEIAEFHLQVPLEGSEQNWLLDPTTGLPLRVTYSLPTQTRGIYARLTWDLSGWSEEGQILMPHQIAESVNGEFSLQACSILKVHFNLDPLSSIFDAR